jgi:hypothetical protein
MEDNYDDIIDDRRSSHRQWYRRRRSSHCHLYRRSSHRQLYRRRRSSHRHLYLRSSHRQLYDDDCYDDRDDNRGYDVYDDIIDDDCYDDRDDDRGYDELYRRRHHILYRRFYRRSSHRQLYRRRHHILYRRLYRRSSHRQLYRRRHHNDIIDDYCYDDTGDDDYYDRNDFMCMYTRTLRETKTTYVVLNEKLFSLLCFYFGQTLQRGLIRYADSKVLRDIILSCLAWLLIIINVYINI